MGHVERKKRDQENIRASILNAAINLAKSEGWSAVTIRKIAEAIEYTPPIVYEYFKNKDDLIHEIIIYGFQKLRQMGSENLLKTSDPKEKLLALSLVHWDFSYEHRELYQLMFSLERPLPNDEAEKGAQLLKDIFGEVTKRSNREIDILIFNWVCVLNGTISMIMQFDKPEHPLQEKFSLTSRELFMQFMQRFIDSITH
ncbi:TetR/AcrR family transcriptional regulator [Paludibacter jiangxiensis]|uniref:DNA-binding transcriptional regulator, AcrR family n=1 Tax=Paludibacter jiangxiensis TaxID=681398 RepID=A0A161LD61_9BACT|nr:TetR/AcrR family transcriptional regulator [Paludibacter jiangxiensis]GAT62015.1 DNA-binding transcriptional regulator, AcrR family [Paludibacter jiangxiensis]